MLFRSGAKDYANQLLVDLENNLDENGKELSEMLQQNTGEMLSKIQEDVIELIKVMENTVGQKTDEIRENMKELKKMNG